MLAAGALSKNLGLLDKSELELLREGVHLCGPLPSANHLNEDAIIKAIGRDKKRSSGDIQWVLLDRIGRPRLVDGKEIGPMLLKQSLREALRKPTEKS
jgi:3-dehydroquinate synthetase